jgi:hypothetical protein
MPKQPPRLTTYRCEYCRGLFTEMRPPGPLPRYCSGCTDAIQRLHRVTEARRRPPRRDAGLPGLVRPPRGNPRKG